MTQAVVTAGIYAFISGSWTQLDDVQPWDSAWGIDGDGPLDLVANTGELKFKLNNSGGLYTPGGPSALAGFARGVPVKLVVTFESEEYIRFRGYITDIDIKPNNRDKTASVTALDWLDYAASHPIINPSVLTSKRADELLDVVMPQMEVAPQQTAFERGTFTLPTAFDSVTKNTTAYSEFAKISFSDIAPIYLKKDKANGETLIIENADKRHGWVLPGEIPLANADSDTLQFENGDTFQFEDGTTFLLNETAAVTFGGTVLSDFEATYGDMVINRAIDTVYPRRVSASAEILFQLDEPFELAPRPFITELPDDGTTRRPQTKNTFAPLELRQNYILEGTWADPQGGNVINGFDMITPVITTDYLMNTAEDGSGSNISADLVFNIEMGSNGFTAVFANNNTATGYVTQFNVRGYGIFEYNPVEYSAINEESIIANEAQTLNFQQKYRANTRLGKVFVDTIVEEYGDARTRLKSVSFCANKSTTLMMAFLHTDVGDLRHIDIDELGIDGNYYIQGVEAKYAGGLIWVTWNLKEEPSLQGGFTGVAMELGGAGTQHAVNFGPLPRVSVSTVTERTFTAWIYLASVSADVKAIIAPFADSGGVMLYASGGGIILYSNRHDANPGIWGSLTTTMSINTWYLVTCSYNHTSTSNTPTMYINTTAQALNTIESPSGNLNDELGTHVVVGNAKTVTQDYSYPFYGKIYDARIYDRIITADEVTTLYNGGTPDASLVTDGLVFQAFAMRTADATALVDTALRTGDKVFENAYKSVGTIISGVTVRAAP